jgi:uncharacterized protein
MEGFWASVMAALPWVILALCTVVGLAGTLLPGIPGGGLILAGVVTFAIWTGFEWLSWPTLVLVSLLALVGGIGQYFVSSYGARKFGASRWGAVGAAIGFFVGLVFSPIGALAGAFAGAMVVELIRHRRADNIAERERQKLAEEKGELLPALEPDDEPLAESPPPPPEDEPGTELVLAADHERWQDRFKAHARNLRTRTGDGLRRAGEAVGESKLPGQTRKATMAGVGAVVGAVGSFLFEFVFGLIMVLVILVGLLV